MNTTPVHVNHRLPVSVQVYCSGHDQRQGLRLTLEAAISIGCDRCAPLRDESDANQDYQPVDKQVDRRQILARGKEGALWKSAGTRRASALAGIGSDRPGEPVGEVVTIRPQRIAT